MGFVTVSWIFGSVWATAIGGAPFSLFARDLGASEFQIGVLAALPFLASLVSMPASAITERTGARKSIFLCGVYAQRALWFPIAVIPTALAAGWLLDHMAPAATKGHSDPSATLRGCAIIFMCAAVFGIVDI